MRTFLSTVMAMTLVFSAGINLATAADTAKQYKVVYHLNSDDTKHQLTFMGNIQNHINAVGKENLDLRVVMHGPGVTLMQNAKKNEDIRSRVDNLKLQGITFNICSNTLKSKKIDYKTDMYDISDQDIVPSGVAELAILQSKGYAYVKP